jgi:TetR/AcrR family transcriptional regulator, regulator of biofilm formation and stress response
MGPNHHVDVAVGDNGRMSVSEGRRAAPRYGEGRVALLRASVQVIAEQGLRNLTYRSVGRQAGVTHALVAHHFGSRDALLKATLEHSLSETVASITTRPGTGDLDALFGGLATMVDRFPLDQAFQYEIILESRRRDELRPYVIEIYAAYVDALHAELALAGIDADRDLSHLVFSAADGLVFHQLTIGDPELTERALAWLRALLKRLR